MINANNNVSTDSNRILPFPYNKINYGRKRILVDYEEVTPDNVIDVLQKALNVHSSNRRDCEYLINYFLGDQDILYRQVSNTSNINNHTVVNYAFPITREIVGYTLGSPIELIGRGNKQAEVQKVSDSFTYENMNTTDICAAIYASICGVGYYITLPSTEISKDNTPEIPIISDYLDPRDTFIVQSNTIGNPQIMSCNIIRKQDGKKLYICYTDKYKMTVENMNNVTWEFNPIGEDPISILENSLFLTGDWEQAISVMNASNQIASDSLNDIEGTIKSLLVITGAEFRDGEENTKLSQIKDNRLLTLSSATGVNVDAKFISPALESTSVQNIREYLDEARNIITGIPDRENNGNGGDTGTAVLNRNGWTDIEIVARLKEMFIKKARKKQLSVALKILKTLNIISDDLNVIDIDISIGRHTTDNLSTKTTAFSTLVATGELATIDCLELSGLTNRVTEMVERGEKAKEERQKQMQPIVDNDTTDNEDNNKNEDTNENNEE